MSVLRRLFWEEEGQGMVEYGLILALVAVAAVVTLGLMGGEVNKILERVQKALTGDTGDA